MRVSVAGLLVEIGGGWKGDLKKAEGQPTFLRPYCAAAASVET